MQGVSTTKAFKLAVAAFVAMLALAGTLFTTQQAHAVQLADGQANNVKVEVDKTATVSVQNTKEGQTGTWTWVVKEGTDNVQIVSTKDDGLKSTATVKGLKAGKNATVQATFTTDKYGKQGSVTAQVSVTGSGVAKGVSETKSGVTYKATSASAVTVTKVASTKAKVTLNTVTLDGKTYKVTEIGKNALKNNKKVTKVTVGNNVKTIGANAFQNCTKLKTVVVGKNVKTIKANVFKGDKKLKTITIKSTKLTKKSVKNSLKGSSVKTVKVPKSKVKAYKKIFTSANAGKKVTVKK